MDFLPSSPDVWMHSDEHPDFAPFHDVPISPSTPVAEPDQFEPTAAATMREMVFRMAAMQPVHIDPESVKPPKRRNVRISSDPQSTAARLRRERISERIRILQRLVPGGTKMDTASMLDEAVQYLKFLKGQVRMLERAGLGIAGFSSVRGWSCPGRMEQVPDDRPEFVDPMHSFSGLIN